MAYQIKMGTDGILRASFFGDVDEFDMDGYWRDLRPYLDAATQDAPVQLITETSGARSYTTEARHNLTSINKDPRIGRTAVLGANQITRVLVRFIHKASQRENMRLFDQEQEAIHWLKQQNGYRPDLEKENL
ncbi:MAG: STAS/SEC14 domain-containing protein [Chloroflexi bacterium]|nr:MAG: STAS/SEC14 domain-containing protein [Chloroflexota bacterium]MBL1194093.1 STAS/SEC14 domain-containing protein [Chloroflexota bacterium]NOH11387.1 STAS/SEC14 domain-containing protein [Chloroflexota bacterium]